MLHIYSEKISTDITFPNIDVYEMYKNDVLYGYKILPEDGYVMYDIGANDLKINHETKEEIPVIYYRTIRLCPLTEDFNNFKMKAVPRDKVDENFIF